MKIENWESRACTVIRDRIVSSDDYAYAYDLVCSSVANTLRRCETTEIRELGGISKIISEAILDLPEIYHIDQGSKMIADSIACELGHHAQDIRLEAQWRAAGNTPRGVFK